MQEHCGKLPDQGPNHLEDELHGSGLVKHQGATLSLLPLGVSQLSVSAVDAPRYLVIWPRPPPVSPPLLAEGPGVLGGPSARLRLWLADDSRHVERLPVNT